MANLKLWNQASKGQNDLPIFKNHALWPGTQAGTGYACRGARGTLSRVHVPQKCTGKTLQSTKKMQWGCQNVERLTKRLLSCRVFQGTLVDEGRTTKGTRGANEEYKGTLVHVQRYIWYTIEGTTYRSNPLYPRHVYPLYPYMCTPCPPPPRKKTTMYPEKTLQLRSRFCEAFHALASPL